MNNNRTLDLIINDVLTVVKPQQGDWAIRFQIIDELRRVVESVESLRGYLPQNLSLSHRCKNYICA